MPPPLLIVLVHSATNMVTKNDFAKFFSILFGRQPGLSPVVDGSYLPDYPYI